MRPAIDRYLFEISTDALAQELARRLREEDSEHDARAALKLIERARDDRFGKGRAR
jgi:hypothetical protein